MLGVLPRPGLDELLYSVVARYGAMLGQGTGARLILDFFGTSVGVTALDLPRHLDRLAERLPRDTGLCPDTLIRGHTLYPYLTRFAPPAVSAAVRAYMVGEAERRPARLGVMSASFPAPRRLLLCPACARGDASELGLGTWRRAHHLPGVLVCPDHGCALRVSGVLASNRGRGAFTPLSADVARDSTPLPTPRGTGEILLWVARGARDLLERPPGSCDMARLQARLRHLLDGYRWSRAPSLMHSSALAADFLAHPAVRAILSAMQIEWSLRQAEVALNRLLYRDSISKHPLTVLMALAVAGASVDDLLDPGWIPPAPEAPRPGRVRPAPMERIGLPCGNPACARFRGHEAVRDAAAGDAPIRAACPDCGFIYLRDPRRPGGVCVVETGPLWDRMLARKLADPGISARAAARAIGVGPTTVQRHARRLGLWRDEWKDRPKLRLRSETKADRLLARHRQNWAAFEAAGRSVPLKQAPREAFNAYRYLMRHDRGWMDAH